MANTFDIGLLEQKLSNCQVLQRQPRHVEEGDVIGTTYEFDLPCQQVTDFGYW
ncbi:hypothetical protein LZV00_05525 [Pseudomonas kielensis]|nr:hypothetical protein [Pseudomonas kielensis]UZM15232.1 hypothetical protein LZV00_05525 [Pseudomonas kielensis]